MSGEIVKNSTSGRTSLEDVIGFSEVISKEEMKIGSVLQFLRALLVFLERRKTLFERCSIFVIKYVCTSLLLLRATINIENSAAPCV